MSSSTYGAIKLATAEEVGTILKKKMGTQTGYKPKDWADTINLLGKLPIRTASGSIAHFTDGADDVPIKSLTAQILPIQEGTGTPSPSNPRPISGTSVLNVEQRGKNLFNNSNITENAFFRDDGMLVTGAGMAGGWSVSDYIKIKGGENYYFQPNTTAGGSAKGCYYDSEKNFISSFNSGAIALTAPSNACFVRLSFRSASTDIQLELGTTATTYEPYKGTTYPIPLGRTVYGGSAEVVGGSGSITRIKKRLLHTDNWGTAQNAFYLDNFFNDMPNTFVTNKATPKCISEIGKEDDYINNSNEVPSRDDHSYFNQLSPYQNRLWVKDSTFSTLSDFLDYLENNEVYMAIPLATPTDFTFEGEEINSLEGANNIYLDSGEVLDVEYRADIDLLIASLEGNRGLQMMRATSTEETEQTEEVEENEDER